VAPVAQVRTVNVGIRRTGQIADDVESTSQMESLSIDTGAERRGEGTCAIVMYDYEVRRHVRNTWKFIQ
jgi:hypothetical protein